MLKYFIVEPRRYLEGAQSFSLETGVSSLQSWIFHFTPQCPELSCLIFRSADYHLFDKAIVLDQVMREAGVDTEQQLFRDLLLRLRDRRTTVEDWKHLMKQIPAVVGATTPFAEALHLFATASDVAEHNIHKLHASGQPVAMLKAVHKGPGAFKATSEEASGLDPVICIAQDAKVMLCANLWEDVALVNGARGTIVAICYENGHSPPDL